MLLLDTHTYLWFAGGSPLLPQWVNEKIQTSENVFVSIATFWEMAIKNSKGLLELPCPVSEMMKDCEKLKIEILPLKGSHLDGLKTLPFIHKDPFDRIIICQAQAEELSLVTADSFISQYDITAVMYKKSQS